MWLASATLCHRSWHFLSHGGSQHCPSQQTAQTRYKGSFKPLWCDSQPQCSGSHEMTLLAAQRRAFVAHNGKMHWKRHLESLAFSLQLFAATRNCHLFLDPLFFSTPPFLMEKYSWWGFLTVCVYPSLSDKWWVPSDLQFLIYVSFLIFFLFFFKWSSLFARFCFVLVSFVQIWFYFPA